MSNPFEPAAAAPMSRATTPGGPTWGIAEALGVGWRFFISKPLAPLAGMLFVGVVTSLMVYVPMFIGGWALHVSPLSPDFAVRIRPVQFPFSLLLVAVSPLLNAGLIRVYLAVAREEDAPMSLLFSGADRYLQLLTLQLVLGAPTLLLQTLQFGSDMLGLGLPSVMPMIYVIALVLMVWSALGGLFATPLVVDGRTAFEALAECWTMAAGQRVGVALFCVACVVLFIVAECACFLPLFVALPVIGLAGSWVYVRIAAGATWG